MNIDLPDWTKLKLKHWISGVMMCLGTLAPGTLIIYQFRPALFSEISVGKLVLFAVSMTMPAVVINLLVALPHVLLHGTIKFEDDTPVDAGELYLAACGFAGVALYAALGVAYIFSLKFRAFLITVGVAEALLATWTWAAIWSKYKNSKRRG